MHLKKELEDRGLLYQFSNEKVFDLYDQGGQKFYCGYDPTANSLTIGHLVSLMNHVQYMKRGNKFYLLLGGATGMIGDPSGKDAERNFLTKEILEYNVQAQYKQVQKLMSNIEKKVGVKLDFELVNNADFYQNMSFLDFLREVGKYITVNTMMNKETVKKRITDPDKSISYTEFSYMLIQGYDFVHLYANDGVRLQTCGSDQRGNCVTGLELIDKKLDKNDAFVASHILLTDSNGKKFGKSEGNAIRLDENKNSPYFVYQYFLNTADADLDRYLKVLTLIEIDEIAHIVSKHNEKPEARFGQKILADRIVSIIFGDDAMVSCQSITEILFGSSNKLEILAKLDENTKLELVKATDSSSDFVFGENANILDVCVGLGLTNSKGEARKLIEQGGIFVQESKIESIEKNISKSDFINGILIVRKGKKAYKVCKI